MMFTATNLAAMAVLALVGLISRATAHLEVNIVAGKDAQAPIQHNTPTGQDPKVLCRTAIVAGDQSGRDPNDPALGAVCHGKEMIVDPKRLATFTAGGQFEWEVLEERLGSGHDGGHCSWWVSDGTDQTKWYKFLDDIDCTAGVKGGIQKTKIKIPKNLPLSCKEACTLQWLWSPLNTGNCEIYSNCFDVKIEGVQGGIEDNYPMKIAPFDCVRVNTETHKTSAFGKFIDVATDGTITMEKVIDGDQDCYQYTVLSGDIIDEVVAKFDMTTDELYSQNVDIMPSATALPPNGTKLVIAGCTTATDKKLANEAAGLLYILVAGTLGVFALSF